MYSKKSPKEILHQYGLKVTNARVKVLHVLMQSQVALSHGDIFSRINGNGLDKVTLYRTLSSFVNAGLAHKVATEDRTWLHALHMPEERDEGVEDHAHFVCDTCERIYCLPLVTEAAAAVPIKESGFQVKSHEYRLHGTCPECH